MITAKKNQPPKMRAGTPIAAIKGYVEGILDGVADTPVTLAAKSHLRNGRPLVIAVSSNDALSQNARSIGQLLAVKHVYFVPFGQDDALGKPCSLVAKFDLIPETVATALSERQIQPLLR